jgi:hypothetical protein
MTKFAIKMPLQFPIIFLTMLGNLGKSKAAYACTQLSPPCTSVKKIIRLLLLLTLVNSSASAVNRLQIVFISLHVFFH